MQLDLTDIDMFDLPWQSAADMRKSFDAAYVYVVTAANKAARLKELGNPLPWVSLELGDEFSSEEAACISAYHSMLAPTHSLKPLPWTEVTETAVGDAEAYWLLERAQRIAKAARLSGRR